MPRNVRDSTEPRFARGLVVDDDRLVLNLLGTCLEPWCAQVTLSSTYEEGMSHLKAGIDLLVVDVHLGTKNGIDLARAAAYLHPAPQVVAVTGLATIQEGLQLGRAGASALLSKPFDVAELDAVLGNLPAPGPLELEAVVRRIVGVRELTEVLDSVRRSMVREALARASNVKSHAASLLGITRQHLDKILERGSF